MESSAVAYSKSDESGHEIETPGHGLLLYAILGLSITFSTSLEGSVIEMKPTAPVPVDTMINLKAKFHQNF